MQHTIGFSLAPFNISIAAILLVSIPAIGGAQTIYNVPPDTPPVTIGTDVIVNLSDGGELTSPVIGDGGVMNMDGGHVSGRIRADSGGSLSLSGGATDIFVPRTGSSITVYGYEFYVDNTLISGMTDPGSNMAVSVPFTSWFDAVLADGMPFSFRLNSSPDALPTQLVLVTVEKPTLPGLIEVSSPSSQHGISEGQRLNLLSGGIVPDYFIAGRGSKVSIEGGIAGSYATLIDAEVTMTSGRIGSDLLAVHGTHLEVFNGRVGSYLFVDQDSKLTTHGGTFGDFFFLEGEAELKGGEFDRIFIQGGNHAVDIVDGSFLGEIRVSENSKLDIHGGEFDLVRVREGSSVHIHGGDFGIGVSAFSTAEIVVYGDNFLLNGLPVPGLGDNLGDSVELPRNMIDALLAGKFSDGSSFEYAYNNEPTVGRPSVRGGFYAQYGATVRLVISKVPEPATATLALVALCLAMKRNR